MGLFQCPHCLASYATLGVLASHMDRDDNPCSELMNHWASALANRGPQPNSQTPTSSDPSTYTDTSGADPTVAYFRIWFLLDGVTIHRREIPTNESFEGFCAQLASLYHRSGSNFVVSQFEYALITKKRDGGTKAEPFTGPISYQRMKSALLVDRSPWRHATVRRIVTVSGLPSDCFVIIVRLTTVAKCLSALESYVNMGPLLNSYQPRVPSLVLTPPPSSFRWISQDEHRSSPSLQTATMLPQKNMFSKRPFQAAEAPPIQLSLPNRTRVHMPAGPSIFPAQRTATPHAPSLFKPSPYKSSPLKWIRPEGPVRHLSPGPVTLKKPEPGSGSYTRIRKVDGQTVFFPARGTPRQLLPTPLAQPPESMRVKRQRAGRSSTALRHKTLPSSPLARPDEVVTRQTAEPPSTRDPPIGFTTQRSAKSTIVGPMGQSVYLA